MKNGPYILVVAPPDYKGRKYRGRYVYEHRLVAERKLGRRLKPGEVAHHRNENKHDNRVGNIEVVTKSLHSRNHHIKTKWITFTCKACRKRFRREECIVRYKRSIGQKSFSCGRVCMGKLFSRNLPPPLKPPSRNR